MEKEYLEKGLTSTILVLAAICCSSKIVKNLAEQLLPVRPRHTASRTITCDWMEYSLGAILIGYDLWELVPQVPIDAHRSVPQLFGRC